MGKLATELEGRIFETKGGIWRKEVFASTPEIETFLATHPDIYNDGRWCGIPAEAPSDEHALVEPYLQLIQQIYDAFQYKPDTRKIVDTHQHLVCHKDGNKTAPDLMVMGIGLPNFPLTEDELRYERETKKASACYRRCVSVIDLRTEANQSLEKDTIQVATYARQCFIEQDNRRFVYTALLTELRMRLLICDRAGVLRDDSFNIHNSPELFVRIILDLCSPDNNRIGVDTSIFWREKRTGKRDDETERTEDQTMTTTDMGALKRPKKVYQKISEKYEQFIQLTNCWGKDPPEVRTYRVKEPLFSRNSLPGKGTKCWVVFDPEDDQNTLIIKDTWRSSKREAEHEVLKDVVGLDGVGQMVAYQDNENYRVSNFRRLTEEDRAKFANHDRTFSRTVLQAYGSTLDEFKDMSHLLHAFRDAVKGHRNLLKMGILHSDVSLDNILFGKEDALDGNKGVLIDLDVAIRLTRKTNLHGTFRTGTHLYQSVSVLSAEEYGPHACPHDHLDDLESYFYCLAMICHTYDGPGKPVINIHPEILAWGGANPEAIKMAFLLNPIFGLRPYFLDLVPLLDSLGAFLHQYAHKKDLECTRAVNRERLKEYRKMKLDVSADPTEELKTTATKLPVEKANEEEMLTDLPDDVNEHYKIFLGYIDRAIQGLGCPTDSNFTN